MTDLYDVPQFRGWSLEARTVSLVSFDSGDLYENGEFESAVESSTDDGVLVTNLTNPFKRDPPSQLPTQIAETLQEPQIVVRRNSRPRKWILFVLALVVTIVALAVPLTTLSNKYSASAGAVASSQLTCNQGELLATTANTERLCQPCPPATYQSASNHRLPACSPITSCKPGQYLVSTSSGIANQVCAACLEGM
jgi:hypothetical protein